MISVLWPILLRLFTKWKMNMNTRNRDAVIFFYFHSVFFSAFHFFPWLCFFRVCVCGRFSTQNTTDATLLGQISRCLVKFVSFSVNNRRTWYLPCSPYLLVRASFVQRHHHCRLYSHLSSISTYFRNSLISIAHWAWLLPVFSLFFSCSCCRISIRLFSCVWESAHAPSACVLYYQVKHYN